MNTNKKFGSFFLYIILLSLFHFSSNQTTRINPENFMKTDIIFDENDKLDDYRFSLIDAKALTDREITLYLKKQGIHLDKDVLPSGQNSDEFNAYSSIMNGKTDFQEIFENTKYNPNSNRIEYYFPVDKIENTGYILYHKVWVINPNNNDPTLRIYFRYKKTNVLSPAIYSATMDQKAVPIELKITCKVQNDDTVITYINEVNNVDIEEEVSSIIFEFSGITSKSPGIAMHLTYLEMKISKSNFSFKGNSFCDKITNPCISGYYCSGGVCKRCHPACFNCVNGGLSTDCYSKCNTHAVTTTPEKGSCSIGYVDLNQFEDFIIENIVPPPRNNRLTISFWMFVSEYPDPDVETTAFLNNNFDDDINIEFKFTNDKLSITCAGKTSDIGSIFRNSWFYVKCAISNEKNKPRYLYINKFNVDTGKNIYTKQEDTTTNTQCGHEFKKYYEPDDFLTLSFLKFNQVKNTNYDCHIYMKQLVLFREYLPEPYDNKYFYMEKLVSENTINIPEILFIIPFDELKHENNLYKIKTLSYQDKVEENYIILNPKESGSSFNLYPPKKFKRLELLDKNKKYITPDLIKTADLTLGTNVSIASYDNVPLSCEDKNFLTFDSSSVYDNPSSYKGKCTSDCDPNFSTFFGLGDTKGFCNRPCETANTECKYNSTDLLNLQKNFECKNTFYNMFYYCLDKSSDNQDNNVFYYDPNYTPANIVLDLKMYNLKSYVIEFWYFTNNCGKITSGYIFYTDQIQIKKVETSYNVYTTSHDIRGNFILNEKYWNQIVLEVYYDPRADRNKKTIVYLQTNYNSGNPLEIDNSENDYKLNYIYFCNGRRASCNNLDLNWYCGYYRKLRVFNGNMAQRHVTFRYDEFFKDYLVSSILLYLPLYGEYITNNTLTQYINDVGTKFLAPYITTLSSNTWNLPQYNYCKRNEETCSTTNCEKCFD